MVPFEATEKGKLVGVSTRAVSALFAFKLDVTGIQGHSKHQNNIGNKTNTVKFDLCILFSIRNHSGTHKFALK